jgi:hypothetical protein
MLHGVTWARPLRTRVPIDLNDLIRCQKNWRVQVLHLLKRDREQVKKNSEEEGETNLLLSVAMRPLVNVKHYSTLSGFAAPSALLAPSSPLARSRVPRMGLWLAVARLYRRQ